MRHSTEMIPSLVQARPEPDADVCGDSIDQSFSPEFLKRLGIEDRPGSWKSATGHALMLALGLAGGFVAKGEILHPAVAHAASQERRASHAHQGSGERELHAAERARPSVHVHGFQEALGINDTHLAEGVREVLAPFMDEHAYRVSFTRAHATIGGVYFGLHSGADMGSRWVELAHHERQADGSHQVVIREAALGGPQHIDAQQLLRNILHEVIHGLGQEHLPYFVQRVRSGSMIPFPYTQQFLEAGRRGAVVNHEHMGSEYRSKLLEAFFAARYVPEEGSFREAVIRHILDRYDVPRQVVEEDVDEVLSWAPPGTWERAIKAYQRLLRETGIELERNVLETRLIRPFEDEALRAELATILHRFTPTLLQRVAHLPAEPSQEALLRDMEDYRQTLVSQMEETIRTEHPDAEAFFDEWKRVVEMMTRRNAYHLKTFSTHGPSSAPMTDADHVQDFVSGMESMDANTVNTGWNQMSPEQREALRPLITEYTRVVSGAFTLPGEYRERVRRLL